MNATFSPPKPKTQKSNHNRIIHSSANGEYLKLANQKRRVEKKKGHQLVLRPAWLPRTRVIFCVGYNNKSGVKKKIGFYLDRLEEL